MESEIRIRHHVVERHARYALLGDEGTPGEVWFGLHGYGQLAHRFARYLRPLDDGSRLLVAPEGLHRYYLDHEARKVGATWMTSEDRLTDIDDYVAWLDRLYATVLRGGREGVRSVALGFSQGVHTLSRWLAFGEARLDVAIVWGASLPPDLELEAHAERLARTRWFLVAGDEDPVFPEAAVAATAERLRSAGIPLRTLTYAGGHRLDRDTLQTLSVEIASDVS